MDKTISFSSDGFTYYDGQVKVIDDEIGRLKFILMMMGKYKSREEVQKEIDRLRKIKEKYIKEQMEGLKER